MSTDLAVQQQNYTVSSDSTTKAWQGTRSGAGFTADLVTQWELSGQCFYASNSTNATGSTMSAAGTSITTTAPGIQIVIPSTIIFVPLFINLAVVTVASKNDIFAVGVSDTSVYTSGGAALTIRNAAIDSNTAIKSSVCTAYDAQGGAIVEGTVTRMRWLKFMQRTSVASDTGNSWNPSYSYQQDGGLTYIHGPADLLVYEVQTTTAAVALFTMKWAELAKGEQVNS